ncbi:MAG TPA: AMP-binding protein [Vicinamibacterales bacterium]|nr:AMP-binding protein [Vicinamibacterales bacterium]
MPRRTLLDFYADLSSTPGEFVVYDDGYRSWSYSYADVVGAARVFAGRLRSEGIAKGQAVTIWAENRAEWIIALWGCLLEGVVLVPIDYRASADFLTRVSDIVKARVVLVGDAVDREAIGNHRPIWHVSELRKESGGLVAPKPDAETEARAKAEATSAGDTAEIIFTSGATAEPKGVVITHKNILANIVPIEREVAKYKKYARPFLPIRFLNLLPLSHMFGQAMATFVPPMLPGVVVFTRSFAPEDIISQIRTRRVSVLVSVPKILEVLREYVLRVAPEAAGDPGKIHWVRKWWKYRRIHRLFGFKFWAMVVGAAPLDPELEAFWGRLGFLVVQGYGLTETAPIVTLNHPFHASRGAVGKPMAGVEVRIAEDGEILVRGENVTTGYYNAPEETRAAFKDGWFHTGDIGEIDAKGQLHIRGRKKEMIVTPEGLNVFPEDIERVLNDLPGVVESAVVGAPLPGSTAERVQAVVVAKSATDLDDLVRQANAQLQDHQKIRAAVAWTRGELPRTEGTRKLKRRELKQWLTATRDRAAEITTSRQSGGPTVESVIARFAPGRAIQASTTIDELGLSSLERVELMMALEESLQCTVDETKFAAATTVADLQELTRPIEGHAATAVQVESIEFPSWSRSTPIRALRRVSLPTWILPLARVFVKLEVRGLEHLERLSGPVIFAANHQSHLDTPVILMSLPARWRYRVAPAMAKEFFKAHFYPEQFGRKAWFTNSLNYYLASTFFNAFPLPQRETGTRQTLRYIGDLFAEGFSLLIFPEGKRTDRGEINRFLPGVGMIASRLDVPVVPVRLDGLDRVLHQSWKFPQRGPGRVTFLPPMLLKGNDYVTITREVEEAIRNTDG